MDDDRSADLLNDLLEVARDGERFYRDAAEKVSTPELKGTFRQMAELRQHLMDDLAHQVNARGEKPSDERTFWGKSRKAYADMLASLRPDSEDLYISELEVMEDRLLEHYEKALQETTTDSVRRILLRHLLTVRAARARMETLKDQSMPA